MPGLRSSNTSRIALIFDIGSGSVGAALVQVAKTKPSVLWNTRKPFPFQSELEYPRYRRGMLGTFSAVVRTVQTEGLPKLGALKPQDIELVFASPWHVSQTISVTFAEKEPHTVNEHLGEVSRLLKEKEQRLSKEIPGGGAALLLEKKIVEMRLNGYPTARPMGKTARTIKTSVLLSLFGVDIQQEIARSIEEIFRPSQEVRFHSFAGMFFSAVRDLFAEEEHFLILDVGSEVTDIGVVWDDVLGEMISFPFGKNSVFRAVSDALKTDPAEVEARISLYRSGKSEPKESEKIRAALSVAERAWQERFTKAIGELSRIVAVPRSVFLTADPDLGEWFRVAVLECTVNAFAIGASNFNVVLLTPEHFNGLIDVAPGTAPDSFLDIEALFIHKNADNPVVE